MEIIRVSLYIWYSMICTFVSHRILLMKISQFLLLNWCRVALAFIPTKSWFLFFSLVEKPFFSLLFLRLFITDIAVFIFIIMQKVEVKFTKKNAEKPDTFLPGEQSLSDADCLYMFHYNGELAWGMYGDIINSVELIRISFSRWV